MRGISWLIWAGALVASEAHPAVQGPSFEIYGFAQADYVQDFKRVDPTWKDTLRPTRIPTTSGEFGSDGQATLSVRQSRFGVKGALPEGGKNINAKFEFDMFGVGVDEGQTTIRLRHAYGQWGQWRAGQTHSLFMDIDVFPNVIDYWGPAGMVFLRNPQIRWTPIEGDTAFAVAIERPFSDIDAGQIREVDPELGAGIQTDDKLPDLTAQVRRNTDWGHHGRSRGALDAFRDSAAAGLVRSDLGQGRADLLPRYGCAALLLIVHGRRDREGVSLARRRGSRALRSDDHGLQPRRYLRGGSRPEGARDFSGRVQRDR